MWNRLTANFWLPEKIPVSNDRDTWSRMSEPEKNAVRKIFAILTMLDTVQGSLGAPELMRRANTPHEEAVYANIAFMEQVHAKSYSTIFSTLCSTPEIDQLFDWVNTDETMQQIVDTVDRNYHRSATIVKQYTSVLVESFLFYSGFYAPLRLAAEGKLTNTADIIRLIMRDEGVHGFYIGYKFQQNLVQQNQDFDTVEAIVRADLKTLFNLACQQAAEIYDPLGWTAEVVGFLKYNANKALANMGFEPMFPDSEATAPSYILSALDIGGNESHDFFSGSGSSYVMGTTEETTDDDWM